MAAAGAFSAVCKLVVAASSLLSVFFFCALILSLCSKALLKFDADFLEFEQLIEFDSMFVEQEENCGL